MPRGCPKDIKQVEDFRERGFANPARSKETTKMNENGNTGRYASDIVRVHNRLNSADSHEAMSSTREWGAQVAFPKHQIWV